MTDGVGWDEVYERHGATGVGWHQEEPCTSLELIALAGAAPSDPIIDVGAGMATLADRLVARGMSDVSVLDVSRAALGARRESGGSEGVRVRGIHADVLAWRPARRYSVWHDRAVFHFLVDPAHRDRYVNTARAAIRPGGHAIVGTFALDGPARCSGHPVERYDPEGLAAAFGAGFTSAGSRREHHTTPSGRDQPFTWVVLRRGREG